VLDAVGAFLAQFTQFSSVQCMRVSLMPPRQHMYRVALWRAVHPKTHAAVPAAGARAAGIAPGIVHTHTADAKSTFGYAHTLGAALALSPAGGYFARLIAGAKQLLYQSLFIGLYIGVLRWQWSMVAELY